MFFYSAWLRKNNRIRQDGYEKIIVDYVFDNYPDSQKSIALPRQYSYQNLIVDYYTVRLRKYNPSRQDENIMMIIYFYAYLLKIYNYS